MPDFSWFSYSCSYLISEVARWEFFSFYFLVEKCSFCYFYVHMMVTKSRSCSFPFHMKMSWFPFDFWKFFLVGCKCPGWHVLFCSGSKKCFFRFWRSCGLCGVLFVWFVWPLWAKCNDKIPFSWAVLKICLFVFNFFTFWLQLLQICFVWVLLCLCFLQLCIHVYFLSKLGRFKIIICSSIFFSSPIFLLATKFKWELQIVFYNFTGLLFSCVAFPFGLTQQVRFGQAHCSLTRFIDLSLLSSFWCWVHPIHPVAFFIFLSLAFLSPKPSWLPLSFSIHLLSLFAEKWLCVICLKQAWVSHWLISTLTACKLHLMLLL